MNKTADKAKPRQRVSGIERSVQIMDLLCSLGRPTNAYEIAKSIGAPISTVYSIVEELSTRSLLTRNEDNTLWLGPRLLRYGLAYESNMDLLTEAKLEMARLSRDINETVQVCYRDEGFMVVVAMAHGEGHFRIASDIGTRVPVNWTASGRLLLGYLPEQERIEAFRTYSKKSPTGVAETNPKKLALQAGEDFQNKLAVQLGASEYAVACIASPICDKTDTCLATISIVLAENKAKSDLDYFSNAVKSAARSIEQALGVTSL